MTFTFKHNETIPKIAKIIIHNPVTYDIALIVTNDEWVKNFIIYLFEYIVKQIKIKKPKINTNILLPYCIIFVHLSGIFQHLGILINLF